MFDGIFELFFEIIYTINEKVIGLLYRLAPFMDMTENTEFNIYLFSDSGWFSQSIPLWFLIHFIFTILVFVFLIRLLWKGTKKFINMIFGVFRV